MKPTGIVRRMDDLGRVVIPKEIRRTLKIKEGDPLEIFTEKGAVCFHKYNPIDLDKWETAKNILRHLLTNGFRLLDDDKEQMAAIPPTDPKLFGQEVSTRIFSSDYGTLGYINTVHDIYTSEELAAAAKIAKEILLS